MRALVAIAFLVAAPVAASAQAGPPGLTPPGGAPPAPERAASPDGSYARSIATSDAVAGGLVATGGLLGFICFVAIFDFDGEDDSHFTCPLALGALGAGAITYAVVPAVIHGRHGNVGRGLLSVGLRVGLPAAGLFLAGDNEDAEVLAFLGGVTGALLIDWFVLAKDGEAPPRAAISVAPTRSGATLGLAGSF